MAPEDNAAKRGRLEIHYLKSSAFREVICDGVIGGITPKGRIWFGAYNERGPVPRTLTYEFDVPPGTTVTVDEANTKPAQVDSRQGIIRTLEVGMTFDLDTARRLHKWLGERIDQMKANTNVP